MNYIIAIDSDGTLRRTDGEISERTKEAITKQIKKIMLLLYVQHVRDIIL